MKTTWKIKHIYDRGEKGKWAHIYNTDPEHSDQPNVLSDYIAVSDLPKYGLSEIVQLKRRSI